jgi:hypothetical protein
MMLDLNNMMGVVFVAFVAFVAETFVAGDVL